MRTRWRRWIPGPKHGLAHGVAVFGVPLRLDSGHLDELLGRCDQLRSFARAHWFELDGSPEDLGLLDQAIDEAIDQASSELGGPSQISAVLTEAGLFLGTVIVATVAGTRRRLWPNGHPVVRLTSGRDLDVAAMASDRASKDAPLLADIYADAAAGPSTDQTLCWSSPHPAEAVALYDCPEPRPGVDRPVYYRRPRRCRQAAARVVPVSGPV